jgi:regulatory protein
MTPPDRLFEDEPASRAAAGDGATPPSITAITTTRQNPERATIRVGRRVVGTLSWRRIDALDLHVGQTWDPPLAARLDEAIAADKALRSARRRLNRRPLSETELRRKLAGDEHPAGAIDEVVEELSRLGMLDDARLGRALIDETLARKPAGPKLLRDKLRRRGLGRELVDDLLAEHRDPGRDVDGAAELARRRLPALTRYDPATRRRRLWGLLARRGFEPDVIDQAVRDVLQDENEPFE